MSEEMFICPWCGDKHRLHPRSEHKTQPALILASGQLAAAGGDPAALTLRCSAINKQLIIAGFLHPPAPQPTIAGMPVFRLGSENCHNKSFKSN